MTESEWGKCASLIVGMWPNQPWGRSTVAAGWELMRDEPFEACRKAIVKMSREGREFPPAPPVVYEYTRTEAKAARLALPEYGEEQPSPEQIAKRRAMIRKAIRRLSKAKSLP